MPCHLCEQMTDLQIGVAIVAVLYVRAFAEQCVGFVEKQNAALTLCGGERLSLTPGRKSTSRAWSCVRLTTKEAEADAPGASVTALPRKPKASAGYS